MAYEFIKALIACERVNNIEGLRNTFLKERVNTDEHMDLFGEFLIYSGLSGNKSLDEIKDNFLNEELFSDLYRVTNSFGNVLKAIESVEIKMYDSTIKELDKFKHLRYFSNDEFFFIPNYDELKGIEIFNHLPNFIHYSSNYMLKFKKQINKSSYCNIKMSPKEFDNLLSRCALSLIPEELREF